MCQTTSRIWKFHGNIRKNSWNYNKSMKSLSNYNGNMKNLSNFDRKNVRNLVLLMFKKQGQKHMWFCCVKIQHIEFCRDTSSTGIALAPTYECKTVWWNFHRLHLHISTNHNQLKFKAVMSLLERSIDGWNFVLLLYNGTTEGSV